MEVISGYFEPQVTEGLDGRLTLPLAQPTLGILADAVKCTTESHPEAPGDILNFCAALSDVLKKVKEPRYKSLDLGHSQGVDFTVPVLVQYAADRLDEESEPPEHTMTRWQAAIVIASRLLVPSYVTIPDLEDGVGPKLEEIRSSVGEFEDLSRYSAELRRDIVDFANLDYWGDRVVAQAKVYARYPGKQYGLPHFSFNGHGERNPGSEYGQPAQLLDVGPYRTGNGFVFDANSGSFVPDQSDPQQKD